MSDKIKEKIEDILSSDSPKIILGMPFGFTVAVNPTFSTNFHNINLERRVISVDNTHKITDNLSKLQDTLKQIENYQKNGNNLVANYLLPLNEILNKISGDKTSNDLPTCFSEDFNSIISLTTDHSVYESNLAEARRSTVVEGYELYNRFRNGASIYSVTKLGIEILGKEFDNLLVVNFERSPWENLQIKIRHIVDTNTSSTRKAISVLEDDEVLIEEENHEIYNDAHTTYKKFHATLIKALRAKDLKSEFERVKSDFKIEDPYAYVNQINIINEKILKKRQREPPSDNEMRKETSNIIKYTWDAAIYFESGIHDKVKNLYGKLRAENVIGNRGRLYNTLNKSTLRWYHKFFLTEIGLYLKNKHVKEGWKRTNWKRFFKYGDYPRDKPGWIHFKKTYLG